jgi:glycerophosphoryl diester phosphodiesterase
MNPVPAAEAGKQKELVAHRGASAYAPEHTLEAYRLAIEQGADYVEQDLQVSKDGVLVCLHDRTLERTTNVEEVFPKRFRMVTVSGKERKVWFVVDFTLAELKLLDAGSWFSEEHSASRILTFQEAIDFVKGKAGLYPELKDPEFYAQEGIRMEGLLLEVLRANSLDEPGAENQTPLVIQSFSESSLRRLRFDLGCRLPLTYLVGSLEREAGLSHDRLKEIKEFAAGIGPSKKLLLEDPELLGRAHSAGLLVTPYTFRSASVPESFEGVSAEMEHYLYKLGVDALFTDNPDQFPRRLD